METLQRRLSLLRIAILEADLHYIKESQPQWAVHKCTNGPSTVKQRRLLKQDGSGFPITQPIHKITPGSTTW